MTQLTRVVDREPGSSPKPGTPTIDFGPTVVLPDGDRVTIDGDARLGERAGLDVADIGFSRSGAGDVLDSQEVSHVIQERLSTPPPRRD